MRAWTKNIHEVLLEQYLLHCLLIFFIVSPVLLYLVFLFLLKSFLSCCSSSYILFLSTNWLNLFLSSTICSLYSCYDSSILVFFPSEVHTLECKELNISTLESIFDHKLTLKICSIQIEFILCSDPPSVGKDFKNHWHRQSKFMRYSNFRFPLWSLQSLILHILWFKGNFMQLLTISVQRFKKSPTRTELMHAASQTRFVTQIWMASSIPKSPV